MGDNLIYKDTSYICSAFDVALLCSGNNPVVDIP